MSCFVFTGGEGHSCSRQYLWSSAQYFFIFCYFWAVKKSWRCGRLARARVPHAAVQNCWHWRDCAQLGVVLLAAFTLVTVSDGLLARAGASWEMAAGHYAHTHRHAAEKVLSHDSMMKRHWTQRFVYLRSICRVRALSWFPDEPPDPEDSSGSMCTLFRLTKFQIQPLVEKTLSSVSSRNAEDLTLDY